MRAGQSESRPGGGGSDTSEEAGTHLFARSLSVVIFSILAHLTKVLLAYSIDKGAQVGTRLYHGPDLVSGVEEDQGDGEDPVGEGIIIGWPTVEI